MRNVIIFCAATFSCWLNAMLPLQSQVPYEKDDILRGEPNKFTWVQQPWRGNDTSYKKARTRIDAAVAAKQDIVAMAQRNSIQAQADLLNPLKQFRWAYASYQVTRVAPKSDVDFVRSLKRLREFSPPYNYEFARLRFIMEAKMWPVPDLKIIGRRLAQHNPRDYDVVFYLASVLDPGKSLAERQEALGFGNDLIRIAPNRSSAHTTLGSIYFRSWLVTKNRSDAQKSIAAYERYLKIAPQNDSFRLQAMRIIFMLKNSTK